MTEGNISVNFVDFDLIHADYDVNPRGEYSYSSSEFVDLLTSIEKDGVKEPLILTKYTWGEDSNKEFIVIAGHRRHRAVATILKNRRKKDPEYKMSVPAAIRNVSKEEYFQEIVSHQARNSQFTTSETAKALLQLRTSGLSDKKISAITGYDEAKIAKYISLNILPDSVSNIVDDPNCRFTNAVECAKVLNQYSHSSQEPLRKSFIDIFQRSYASNTDQFKSAIAGAIESFNNTKAKGAISKKAEEVKKAVKPGRPAGAGKSSGISIPGLSGGKKAPVSNKEEDQQTIITGIESILSDDSVNLISEEKIRAKLSAIANSGTSLKEILWTIRKIFDISEEDLNDRIGANKKPKKKEDTSEVSEKKNIGFKNRKPSTDDDGEDEGEEKPKARPAPVARPSGLSGKPKSAKPSSPATKPGKPTTRRIVDDDDDDSFDD